MVVDMMHTPYTCIPQIIHAVLTTAMPTVNKFD